MLKYNEMIQEKQVELTVLTAKYDVENKLYEVTAMYKSEILEFIVVDEKVTFSEKSNTNGRILGKTLHYDFSIYEDGEKYDEVKENHYNQTAGLSIQSVVLPSHGTYDTITTSLENIPHLQADNFVLLQVDFLEMFQAKNAVVALQPVPSHFYTLVTVFGEYMDGGVEYQVEIEGIHPTLESVLKEFDRHDYTYEGFSETF